MPKKPRNFPIVGSTHAPASTVSSWPEKHRVKYILAENGERLPLLVDANGAPILSTTVYVFSEIRARSRAVSTIDSALRSIMLLYLFLDAFQINLQERAQAGKLLTLREIDSLVHMCRMPIEHSRTLATRTASSNIRPLPSVGTRAGTAPVKSAFAATRLRSIRNYVVWLIESGFGSQLGPDNMSAAAVRSFVGAINSRLPVTYSRLRTEREGLDKREMNELLRVVSSTASDNPWVNQHTKVRNELIVWWLLYLGIRRGELLGVRVSDINFQSETVTVHRRADDKADPRLYQPNAKTLARELPMSSALIQLTKEYIIAHRNKVVGARKHDLLFIASETGRPMSIAAFAKIFYVLRQHPLLPKKLFAHLLRHTWNERFSERMDESRTPEDAENKLRSYLMGWSETSGTAATYTRRHIRRKAAEASIDIQSKIFKGRPD